MHAPTTIVATVQDALRSRWFAGNAVAVAPDRRGLVGGRAPTSVRAGRRSTRNLRAAATSTSAVQKSGSDLMLFHGTTAPARRNTRQSKPFWQTAYCSYRPHPHFFGMTNRPHVKPSAFTCLPERTLMPLPISPDGQAWLVERPLLIAPPKRIGVEEYTPFDGV
jgi:hypothetical protein